MGSKTFTFTDIFGCNVTVTYQEATDMCDIQRNGKCCFYGSLPASIGSLGDNPQLIQKSLMKFVWSALVEENGRF